VSLKERIPDGKILRWVAMEVEGNALYVLVSL
jgi:hypothetical protein